MHVILLILLWLGLLSPPEPLWVERPTVNLPKELRQANWQRNGSGSCVWATMVFLLRWQAQPDRAGWVRQNCGGGASSKSAAKIFDQAGIRYAYTTGGEVGFLEWACRTRRGCGIAIDGGEHMVALVYLDDKWAGILDNNHIEKVTWVPRETLITEWQGWAITPVYSPVSPLPQ